MAQVSKGAAGEVLAARFLREKGYRIIGANVHTRFGEVDIIAVDKRYIVFVEVKARGENSLMAPRESVTLTKQKKVIRAAMGYLQRYPTELQPRFDVVEIVTDRADPMKILEIDHLENAYETGDLHEAF